MFFSALVLAACGGSSSSGGRAGDGGASGGAGGSGGTAGGSGGTGADICQSTCEAVAGVCAGDTPSCVSGCKQGYAIVPLCTQQLDAVNQCAATRPDSDFSCDAGGQPQLKAGVCPAEVAAVQACVGAH